MFCNQCQETFNNKGCTLSIGACGKHATTSDLQDLLVYTAKGIAVYATVEGMSPELCERASVFVLNSLFITITNANFDDQSIFEMIQSGLELRSQLAQEVLANNLIISPVYLHSDYIVWSASSMDEMLVYASKINIITQHHEDMTSLAALLLNGLKGLAAYTEHARHLGYHDSEVMAFVYKALLACDDDTILAEELTNLVLECGAFGVKAMALLDKANTTTFGHPTMSHVNLGVQDNPGILISGHDLYDLKQLLEQTEGTGVDVYTHSEMLPGHYYPELKKYSHFVGNYGGAWYDQKNEFESFNGPIVFTTNCIVPPNKDASYNDRTFTTNAASFPGWKRIVVKADGSKDFTEVIKLAQILPSPTEIETGSIVGGFAHNQVLALADKVVEAVKNGDIKQFIVMAGCDGRHADRNYYTEFAKQLSNDTVILTAGCAKYRYNKLELGDINGIPRVLDAGQCNDSYSLAVIAMTLQEVFGLDDINELPIIYNIAWYEQKAVIVLLALLSLGVKNIHLGPTIPAFLSKNVVDVLINNFGIQPGGIDVMADLEKWNVKSSISN